MYWNSRPNRRNIVDDIYDNQSTIVEQIARPFKAPMALLKVAKEKKYPSSLINLYESMNGFIVDWKTKTKLGFSAKGKLNILPLEETFKDWKEVVYFVDSDERLKHFIPIDFFADEACIGIYVGEYSEDCAYFFNFAEDPKPLFIDMCQYFDLALMARGFLYWQYVIFSINENEQYSTVEDFKDIMPKIFKNFNYENLVEMYKEFRF